MPDPAGTGTRASRPPRSPPTGSTSGRSGTSAASTVAGLVAELGLDDLAERVQIRAAVRVDGTLRAPGGTGRVVDRDRLLLAPQLGRRGGGLAVPRQLTTIGNIVVAAPRPALPSGRRRHAVTSPCTLEHGRRPRAG